MSEDHETFEVHLSAPQIRKLKNGVSFQLNSSQLSTGTTGHKVKLTMHRKHYRRMLSNIKNKKGYRFKPEHINGGSVWNAAANVWDTIKEKGKQVLNFVKTNIPKDVIQEVANQAIDAFAPESVKKIAKRVSKKLIDSGTSANLTDEMKDSVQLAAPQKYKKNVKSILDKLPVNAAPVEGSGFKRFKKGSAEAAEWGRKMKAMRDAKKTGGFIPPVVGALALKVAAPLLPKAGSYIGETLGGKRGERIGRKIGKVAKTVLGGSCESRYNHLPHGQMINGVPSVSLTNEAKERIKTCGLNSHQKGKNGLISGGSFLSL